MSKSEYSLTEVAQMCFVPRRAVQRWLDSGRLRHQLDPETGNVSIPRSALAKFLEENEMPMSGLEADPGEGINAILAQLDEPLRERFLNELMRQMGENSDG